MSTEDVPAAPASESPAAPESPEVAPKETPKEESVAAPSSSNPLVNAIIETFMWRNIPKSAGAFVAVNVLFLLVLKWQYSFLTLTCYLFLAALASTFAYAYGLIGYGKFVAKKEFPNPFDGLKFAIPEQFFVDAGRAVGGLLNMIIAVACDVLFFRNVACSVEATFGLLFLSWLGKRVRLTTLVYIAIDFCFIWVRLYHEQHAIIDKYAGIAYKAIAENVAKGVQMAKEKLPPSIKEKLQ